MFKLFNLMAFVVKLFFRRKTVIPQAKSQIAKAREHAATAQPSPWYVVALLGVSFLIIGVSVLGKMLHPDIEDFLVFVGFASGIAGIIVACMLDNLFRKNLDSSDGEEGDKGGNRRRILLLVAVWLPGLVCFHIACFNLDLWWLAVVSFAYFAIASALTSRFKKRKQSINED